MTSPFSGIVLAAGRSQRMGRDKAVLEADGVPLWRRQREVLLGAGASEVFLSARSDQLWIAHASGFAAILFDALPDCGPIVGLTAGIERMSHPHLAVIAVDLPHMTAEWFQSLAAQCAPGVGCVGRNGTYYEPLAAIYPREMKWLAWEQIARGEYGLQPLLAAAEQQGLLRAIEITPAQKPWFDNWNTPPAVSHVGSAVR